VPDIEVLDLEHVDEREQDNDAEHVANGRFKRQDRFGVLSHVEVVGERDHDRRRGAAKDRTEHAGLHERKAHEILHDHDADHGDADKVRDRDRERPGHCFF